MPILRLRTQIRRVALLIGLTAMMAACASDPNAPEGDETYDAARSASARRVALVPDSLDGTP